MKFPLLLAALCVVASLLRPALAADEHGHDHGAPTAAAGAALPRFAAESEAFELVGIVDGRQLTVYLDHFADNAPVKGATIELEIAGAKVALTAHEDGEYHAALPKELPPGTTAITATVVVGTESDLLAADLLMPEAAHAAETHAPEWRRYAAWAAAIAVALALLWGLRRALAVRRHTGGAA